MHNLAPLCPLGGDTPRSLSHGGMTLSETVDTALASVSARAGTEQSVATTMCGYLGTDLPAPGHASFGETLSAFWIGPQQWMVQAPFGTHELLADDLKATLADHASVTEQTDGWCRFDLAGAAIAQVMERLCAVDFHGSAPGLATRTSVEHLGCFVVLRDAQHLAILGPRSAAGSLWHALEGALRSAL